MNARREAALRADSKLDTLRVPPQSIPAEQAVLGGVMLAPEALDLIRDTLTEDDFYRRDHRLIWRAILEQANPKAPRPIDAVTLGEWFEARGLAEQIDGTSYLIELASTTPSAANIRSYAEIVREKSVLRRLITAGTEIVNAAFKPEGRPALEVLGDAQASLGRILTAQPAELETPGPIVARLWERAAKRFETGHAIEGLTTGIPELDAQICGLKGGQLIVIAGRPKMGKTTLARNIAEHVALRLGKRVAFHSLEMTPEDLLEASACAISGVEHEAVRHWTMDAAQSDAYNRASARLASAPWLFSRPRNTRVEHAAAQTRRAHAEAELGLVVIDFLQLFDLSGYERRDIAIAEVARTWKLLAGSLNVPVILLSQLNRGLESRTDKRPTASDLRDGGAIEENADVAIFVYRDEVYHPASADRGTAELIVGLQRSGPIGTVRVASELDRCRFAPLPSDWTPRPLPSEDDDRDEPQRRRAGFRKPRVGSRARFTGNDE